MKKEGVQRKILVRACEIHQRAGVDDVVVQACVVKGVEVYLLGHDLIHGPTEDPLKKEGVQPSLRTHKRRGEIDLWQARVTRSHRLYFELHGETITLIDVGPHEK